MTHDQIAHALSTATGRDITFHEAPAERFTAALTGLLPPWQVDGLVEDYAHHARGEAADVHTSPTSPATPPATSPASPTTTPPRSPR